MNTIKKISMVLLLAVLFLPCIYSQQQHHIPWPSLADSPWPFIRGDMQATGRSRYIGPGTNNVIWRKDMPLGIIYGPVITYNDILYTGTDAVFSGGINFFYAIDMNGQDLWTFETETYLPNNIVPIVANDSTVYFGSANHSIYALYPDGELKWQLQNVLWGWPHCYITFSKNGDLYVPSSDTLLIIDPIGVIKERRIINELKGRSFVFSSGGDTVFYFTGGGDISNPGSLNAALLNGTLLWSYEFDTHNLGTPLVDNSNKVYVFGTDIAAYNNFYLYSINPSGILSWRHKIDAYEYFSSPTMDKNGNIIFHAIKNTLPEGEHIIISLDYFGNKNWETVLPGDYWSNFIDHGLVCDSEGKIYFGSTLHGNFYCLNQQGEILWSLDLEDYEYDSSPAIGSDGTLYIGTHWSSTFQNHKRNLIAIRDTVTSVGHNNSQVFSYYLEQNYPNPFNSFTNIKYTIPLSGSVTIKVFDIMGSEVTTLLNRYQAAGSYDVIFQPKDLASGIYFYTLSSGNFAATKKLILLK
jgi:outer membrane protein assembly factor BamB